MVRFCSSIEGLLLITLPAMLGERVLHYLAKVERNPVFSGCPAARAIVSVNRESECMEECQLRTKEEIERAYEFSLPKQAIWYIVAGELPIWTLNPQPRNVQVEPYPRLKIQ